MKYSEIKYWEAIDKLPPGVTSGAPRPILAMIEIQLTAKEVAARKSARLEDITLADIVKELRRPRELATAYETTPHREFCPADPKDAELFRRYECLLSVIRKYIPEEE